MKLKLNPDVPVKSANEIMVGFAASQQVESDCWREEVAYTCNMLSNTFADLSGDSNKILELYKDNKKANEREFKEKNGLTQMPSKYRSAKSVICKALKNDVELLDLDGRPRGKTEVEKELAGLNKATHPFTTLQNSIVDSDHELLKAAYTIVALYPTASDSIRTTVRTILKGINL